MTIHRRNVLSLGTALAIGATSVARATTYWRPERYIYFDHGSAELSPAAVEIIRIIKPEAEGWAGPSEPVRYELVGSIDGVETARRLKALIARRVEAVAKALVESGVDPAAIVIRPTIPGDFPSWKRGEDMPLARAVHMTPL